MNRRNKILIALLLLLIFLAYIAGNVLLIMFVFKANPNNMILNTISWIIIFEMIFVIIYSLFTIVKNAIHTIKKDAVIDLMNIQKDIYTDNALFRKKLKRETYVIYFLYTFILFLEFLTPIAIDYLSKSYFSLISIIIVIGYFNLDLFKSKPIKFLSRKESPYYYQLLDKVRDELKINQRIYLVPEEGLNAILFDEQNKLYISVGIDLLYIFSEEELLAFFYNLCSVVKSDHFKEINYYLKILNYIKFISNKGFFPIVSSHSLIYSSKVSFYISYLGEMNKMYPFFMVQDSNHYQHFLSAKYKKQLHRYIDLYLTPLDLGEIDLNNYFSSRIKIQNQKVNKVPWINKIVESAIRSHKDYDITLKEIIDTIGGDDYQVANQINENDELNRISSIVFHEKEDEYRKKFLNNAEIIHLAKEAIDNQKENLDFDDQLEVVFAYFSLGEYQIALDLALNLYQSNPNNDVLNMLIGNIYIKGFNSYKCEDYLSYNFVKDEFKVNSTFALEEFYCRNGDQQKMKDLTNRYFEAQRIVTQNKYEEANIFNDKKEISPIKKEDKNNIEIIEFIKSFKSIKTLIMFEKFTSTSYKLVVLISGNTKQRLFLNDFLKIKNFLLNYPEINTLVIKLDYRNRKIIKQYQDYVIFEKDL